MKKNMIHLAGLTLAFALHSPLSIAQAPPARSNPPVTVREARIEIENDNESDLLAIAKGADEAARTVRKIFAAPGNVGERPLIVTSTALDEKALSSLDEDLNVMARILNKAVSRGGSDDHPDREAMGIHLWALGQPGKGGARNLYLDGYGAVFILNVNMLLQAPASKPKVEEKKETVNSTWEEARNEIYGREHDDVLEPKRREKRVIQAYDAGRVEELKKNLSEALKNASHIRGLKENESVTLVIQGVGAEKIVTGARSGSNRNNLGDAVFAYAFSDSAGRGPRAIMTLRAKRATSSPSPKKKSTSTISARKFPSRPINHLLPTAKRQSSRSETN